MFPPPRIVRREITVVTLWPRRIERAGDMLWINAQVRIRCCRCGTLMRAELKDIVARHVPD
jgi:hypothetical protein